MCRDLNCCNKCRIFDNRSGEHPDSNDNCKECSEFDKCHKEKVCISINVDCGKCKAREKETIEKPREKCCLFRCDCCSSFRNGYLQGFRDALRSCNDCGCGC